MDTEHLSRRLLLERASRAVGKINEPGLSWITMVTVEEVEAMALALASLGLVPTPAGHDPVECLFVSNNVESALFFTEGPQ